jgi:glycerol-3-phosphate dehydrogenase (NAD(P)+)
MGGNPFSAYGLCHLGDYEATVFSKHSHNRMFGESFIKGQKYEKLAEGYYTAEALMFLSEKYSTPLPICEAVYNILYKNEDPKEALNELFSRRLTNEF